jgi:hypothetical protein
MTTANAPAALKEECYREIDLGISADDCNSDIILAIEIGHAFEEWIGTESHSSGAGLGYRDLQIELPNTETRTNEELLRDIHEWFKTTYNIDVDTGDMNESRHGQSYVSIYWNDNKLGIQVDEDDPCPTCGRARVSFDDEQVTSKTAICRQCDPEDYEAIYRYFTSD